MAIFFCCLVRLGTGGESSVIPLSVWPDAGLPTYVKYTDGVVDTTVVSPFGVSSGEVCLLVEDHVTDDCRVYGWAADASSGPCLRYDTAGDGFHVSTWRYGHRGKDVVLPTWMVTEYLFLYGPMSAYYLSIDDFARRRCRSQRAEHPRPRTIVINITVTGISFYDPQSSVSHSGTIVALVWLTLVVAYGVFEMAMATYQFQHMS